MTVKDVLKSVTQYLQLSELYAKLCTTTPTFTTSEQLEIDLLTNCINFTVDTISTDYFRLKNKYVVENTSGVVLFSSISSNVILDVTKVVDFYNGDEVDFEITSTGVDTLIGKIIIYYDYLPTKVSGLSDTISCYPIKLTERIIAFGVASEYLFLKGNIDDSSIWDVRFKNAVLNIAAPRHIPQIPKRRWLL